MSKTTWRKSSRSADGQSACVEVAVGLDAVGVRDSKNRKGSALHLPAPSWHAFVRGLR